MSTLWDGLLEFIGPDLSDDDARHIVDRFEQYANRLIGAVPCPLGTTESHAEWWMPATGCPWCRAVV